MRGLVLVVDDDQYIARLVVEVLTEEGFAVAELVDPQPVAIRRMVARLEPDVVLLDGGDAAGYGQSWSTAAWLHARERPIGVIMFTAHARELAEAQLGASGRSQGAAFVGFVAKPFDLEVLVDTVAGAVQEPAAILSVRWEVTPASVACMANPGE